MPSRAPTWGRRPRWIPLGGAGRDRIAESVASDRVNRQLDGDAIECM
jgi:hypothetical protein